MFFPFSFQTSFLSPGPNACHLFQSIFFPSAAGAAIEKENKAGTTTEEDSISEELKAKASELPSVPTTDPADPNHAQKKQKQDTEH